MIVALSRFRVANARQDTLADAFAQRVGQVDREPGFLGLEVFTDAVDDALFYLFTRWVDEACFHAWHGSEAFRVSQRALPGGFKLDRSATQLSILRRIPSGARYPDLEPAILDAAPLLASFLHATDSVLFGEFDGEGTPRVANAALAQRLQHESVWQRLSEGDAQALRARLAAHHDAPYAAIRLHLRHEQENTQRVECHVHPRADGFALIGRQAEPDGGDALFEEITRINNDLSSALRDKAQHQRELDRALATLKAKNVALEHASALIEELSRTDALTGVYNRRHLDAALDSEISRAGRQGSALSLVMLDLDHFKAVNDTLGHVAGDQVLAAAGRTLAALARPYDVLARYGGEEFVLLLPGVAAANAAQQAERLREAIADMRVDGHDIRVTASFGVAMLGASEQAGDLLRRADAALYRAKALGRNRVELDAGEADDA